MTAAVVELDTLTDAIRPTTQDHHLRPRRGIRLALLLVRAVQVRRKRFELRRAGVDPLERGLQSTFDPGRSDRLLVGDEDRRQLAIADAGALQRAQHVWRCSTQTTESSRSNQFDDLRKLRQEPAVDVRELVQLVDRPPTAEGAEDGPHAPIGGHAEISLQPSRFFLGREIACGWLGDLAEQQPTVAELERAEGLHERFFERAADRHHLAHRLHLRRQGAVCARELLEGPARDLDNDVVDRRLEGSGRESGDVVGNFVEVIAERELRRNLRNRKSRRLRRQRR